MSKALKRVLAAAIAASALVFCAAVPAGASDVSQAQQDLANQGQMLAELNCARCHSIKASGNSAAMGAPPMREYAQKWPLDALAEALAEGIVTGHPDMPEFVFTPDQISALMAFLETLAE